MVDARNPTSPTFGLVPAPVPVPLPACRLWRRRRAGSAVPVLPVRNSRPSAHSNDPGASTQSRGQALCSRRTCASSALDPVMAGSHPSPTLPPSSATSSIAAHSHAATGQVRRAYVETYGCQMNISDGELMQGILAEHGYAIVDSPDEADVVLVNTCAIRDHAERRVLGRVSQLNGIKRERPHMLIGVTGCMAQRMGTDLLEKAPFVDLVMGPDAYRTLPQQLERILEANGRDGAVATPEMSAATGDLSLGAPSPQEKRPAGSGTFARVRNPGRRKERIQLAVLELDEAENYQGLEQRRTEGASAWVPIQRGCDHRCTYCIVPYVRGPEKNRTPQEILDEIRGLAEGGRREVTLLGQTVNSYRWEAWSFPDLLRAVARIDGIERVRFTSPHPRDVTPEMVDVMATEPAVCEQLHLPAQAGSNRTLRRMLRRYTVESLLEKVEMVRAAMPDIALSTDIIVAFPGETDAEFRETLDLMRTVRFDDAFTYKYSLRDGTPATRFPDEDFVDPDEAQARLEELIQVSRGIQAEINRGEVGRVESVLIEKEARDPGHLLGRTRRNKVVAFPRGPDGIGEFARVRLTGTTGATFSGVRVGADDGDRRA
ncbi:MAG: MiaB/RimO family radical SAM methylthiotransferase [Gemmatimonadales bacterium]|nr:MAG: MiaB/RimO family radical SAM methylthiotransferase [Gemmatimonadales bacterium]